MSNKTTEKQPPVMRRNSPCPECGGSMEFDSGTRGSYWEPEEQYTFECVKCGHEPDEMTIDWENFDDSVVTKEQQKQITKLRREVDRLRSVLFDPANRRKITLPSLFEGMGDGDFSCEGEPEDVGNAWNCGDSDCETGWHTSVQYIDCGRKDGKCWFVVYEDSIAGCGDYQPCAGFDEREGDEATESVLDDLWFHLDGRSIEHFASWAVYCLDVAETGKDPIDNWMSKMPDTASAIAAALDNIKYLRKDVRRLKKK